MNLILFKILILIIASIISLVANYLVLKKSNFFLVVILSIVIETIYLVLDFLLFNSDIVDYIASQMLISFLLSITFEDIITKNIDIRIVIAYMIVFALYRIVFLNLNILLEGLKGLLFCVVILAIPYIIKRNAIGFGDVLSVSACGLIIGYPGVFNFLFKAFLFVFIFGLVIMVTKKKNLWLEIPLAPFLLLATII